MKTEIIVLFCVSLLAGVGYGFIPPLFSSIAVEKNLNEFWIGIVISSYAFSNFFITPFGTTIFSLLGRKKTLHLSVLIEVFIFHKKFIFQKFYKKF